LNGSAVQVQQASWLPLVTLRAIEVFKLFNATVALHRLKGPRDLNAALCSRSAGHLQDQDRIDPGASYKKLNEQPFVPAQGAVHRTDLDEERYSRSTVQDEDWRTERF
jgi:hypothetical protein